MKKGFNDNCNDDDDNNDNGDGDCDGDDYGEILCIEMLVFYDRKSYECRKRCHLSKIEPNKLLLFEVFAHSFHLSDAFFLLSSRNFHFDNCQHERVRNAQFDSIEEEKL